MSHSEVHWMVHWMYVFADVPAEQLARDLRHWQDVTGTAAGNPTGDHRQFVPLEPTVGGRYLWLQRVDRPAGGWHLDLVVPSLDPAVSAAQALGARVEHGERHFVALASPAGLPFCLVREERGERHRPAPRSWPGGHRSEVDQICLDLPAADFEPKADFWAALTGWPRHGGDLAEYERLSGPTELPLRILLQRLGEDDDGGIRAHADLAADDRAGETARHVAFGGVVVLEAEHWTTLRDPAGLVYCITDRRPRE